PVRRPDRGRPLARSARAVGGTGPDEGARGGAGATEPAHAPRALAALRPRRRDSADARGGRWPARHHARARAPARDAGAPRAPPRGSRARALPADRVTLRRYGAATICISRRFA